MTTKAPEEITEAAVQLGAKKARIGPARLFVGSFLAGAYIAFGGMLSIAVASGLDPETWGTLPTLFAGAVFTVGLMLVVLAGSELLTGNFALVPIALLERKTTISQLVRNFALVLLGNLVGALFVAFFLASESGVIGSAGAESGTPALLTYERLTAIAELKVITESNWQIFLRGVGCNWLVCLAVWLALSATETSGKILGIFFPILAFVALGFDHVVANMFFLPLALFNDVPDITLGGTLENWLFAGLGNLVGAAVFVAGAYWFLYGRDDAGDARGTDQAAQQVPSAASNGGDGSKIITPR